jgi:quercetin dioxygenase-like cupin family protein
MAVDEIEKDQNDASTHESVEAKRLRATIEDGAVGDLKQIDLNDVDLNQVDLNQVDLNQVDLSQEIDRLQVEASSEELGRKTKMLVKHPEFRIVLITMRAGSRWEDHKTNARIGLQVLRGDIRFHTATGTFDLRSGQLLTLAPSIVHSVDALEESAFLLTLSSANQP